MNPHTLAIFAASPPGPTQSATVSNCNKWYTVKSGDTCYSVDIAFGITQAQFVAWNPTVSNNCLTNFWPNYSYCVGVDSAAKPTSPPVESSTPSVGPSSTSIRVSPVLTSARPTGYQNGTQSASGTGSVSGTASNATYSVRNPISSYNLSTPTIDRTWPPKRTQTGQPLYCNKWYLVGGGDTCDTVASKFSISKDQL